MAAATQALRPARVLRWVLWRALWRVLWRVLWRMLATLLLGWPVAPAAGQTPAVSIGPRIALIIANGDYATPKDRLSGPLNDAVMLRDALQGRGFGGLDGDRGPSVLVNAGQAQMRQKLLAFRDALDKAGPLALGVLYFAGHGGADAAGKDNYILPVDTPDLATAPMEQHGIAVRWIASTLLGQIDLERRPAIAIVIDACRTPPGTVAQGGPGTAPTRTLVMPDDVVPQGMLIALSTGPGQIAYDSGIYAQVLAEKIKMVTSLPLAALFEAVKVDVAGQSGQAQIPVQRSQGLDKVCLAECRTQPQSDPMVMLRSAIELRAAGDVGQLAVLEQLARDGNSVAGLDLSGQFLAGGRLAGLAAADAKLVLANLQGADVSRARLERSRMLTVNAAQARFDGATLDGSIGAYGLFNRASFVGASLQRVSWEMTDLRDANFNRANLAGADLAFADLRGADFTHADLRGTVLVGADLRGARFDGATFADTDLALALFDGSLRAQVLAGGICATLVGQGAGNYARVVAATNSGSNRQFFEKLLPLPTHADGQLPACQIRVGRVWERRYTLSPIYRAPNSGREFLGLESDFGYDAALLASANRRDMVISRYRQVAQNLQVRFDEFGHQPHTGGRLRQAQLLAALERPTAAPVAPVWVSSDALQLLLMKYVGFKPGVELPDLRQLALMRMHHEYELERLGTAAPMHDAWAPFFPANAYAEDRSDAVLALFKQWLDRRVNTVGRVWLPLRCGSTVAPMTLADCNVGGGNRFARTDGAHAAAQDFAHRFEGRQLRVADVGAYGNGLLFAKPLSSYTVSDTAQPEGSGSTVRHEVELVIERVEVDGKFVVWHVLPGQVRSRPWSAVWPLGYVRDALFE